MKIILTETGEVKVVKAGYARNFLIPNGRGVVATKKALSEIESKKQGEESKTQKLFEGLQGLQIEISAKVGEKGKLFGAITSEDIVSAIKKKGFEVEKKWLELESVKEVGKHKIKVVIRKDLKAEVGLKVVTKKG